MTLVLVARERTFQHGAGVREIVSLLNGNVTPMWHLDQTSHPRHRQERHVVLKVNRQRSLQLTPPDVLTPSSQTSQFRVRRLRSAASRTCTMKRTYSTFGDRAFVAAGPGLWNTLPSHLKEAEYRTIDSGCRWWHFCLDSEATSQCELF